jgi:2,3-bisphosphoglycerate-dependent phosphoglycerate mutase
MGARQAAGHLFHARRARLISGPAHLSSTLEELAVMLVLVRHGQSEWNKLNLFTGWRDPDLTEQGIEEARRAGRALKADGVRFDIAFTSGLVRAQRTLNIILDELGQSDIPITRDVSLNERDYGDLAGLNKDDARERWGEEQVHIWRRSYDTPPPGGESLKDTAERVLPFYQEEVVPLLKQGKNVIVSAHGNSLRALMMQLDDLSTAEVTQLNLATGVPVIYEINAGGSVVDKRQLSV